MISARLKQFIEENIETIEKEDWNLLKYSCPFGEISSLCKLLFDVFGVRDFELNHLEKTVQNTIRKKYGDSFTLLSLVVESSFKFGTKIEDINVDMCAIINDECVATQTQLKYNSSFVMFNNTVNCVVDYIEKEFLRS